ncbi:protein FAM227B isoform X1 [Leopardus geoffroyi]|uniref:protein FAM227B isoform X1 n=1 Tax=Leopardus geoffroyi TaxID=46844 RepID=UPI001E25F459|nr:protein FAM227B isoform X1 [Leopardus geoffroyi]XP_045305739.1 protein FAM227B isoform X1 [Leopardus geoffroyi]
MADQQFPQWMVKDHCRKMHKPPMNIEEFLKFQNWDYWPREIYFGDNDKWLHTVKKMKEDSSFTSIYTHLWGTVPRIHDAIITMESRLGECSILLKNHASKILDWNSIISETSSKRKLERYKAFLRKHHKRKKIMLSDEMETKKTVEGCSFSGFKTNELTQLPRHLDAEQIYLFILKTQKFDEKVFKIWKTHFLSEASIALLHDSFWWWFLHKFKPDRENQDSLFDRISESYVVLFMSIPASRKDTFLQVYPDCLAQAIYATFQEAFPESSNIFNDEFKEDLGNNIFLWLSGLKPPKGFWTHWKLKELSTTTIHGTKKAPSKSLKDRIERSQERITTAIDFNMMKILKNPRAYTMPTFKEESSVSRLTTKSHYSSTCPEFNRVLFNFGGQSPLILYYLKMHELAGISKAPKQTKIKFTEILQEPPPAPTYRDIIKEAKRQFAKNQKDFRIEKHRINEEIKLLRQRQERIDKELDRLQVKATKKPYEAKNDFDKFLHKLRSEARTEREFLASLSSSTSSTEDYNCEEECQEKPEMDCI